MHIFLKSTYLGILLLGHTVICASSNLVGKMKNFLQDICSCLTSSVFIVQCHCQQLVIFLFFFFKFIKVDENLYPIMVYISIFLISNEGVCFLLYVFIGHLHILSFHFWFFQKFRRKRQIYKKKKKYREVLYTLHQVSPVVTSCITVVWYQKQKTDIGKIHIGYSYFTSFIYIHLSLHVLYCAVVSHV